MVKCSVSSKNGSCARWIGYIQGGLKMVEKNLRKNHRNALPWPIIVIDTGTISIYSYDLEILNI